MLYVTTYMFDNMPPKCSFEFTPPALLKPLPFGVVS